MQRCLEFVYVDFLRKDERRVEKVGPDRFVFRFFKEFMKHETLASHFAFCFSNKMEDSLEFGNRDNDLNRFESSSKNHQVNKSLLSMVLTHAACYHRS